MSKKINYLSKDFASIRTDLINLVVQYYPSIYNDFNDASVGMMLLELNSAVGDMLSHNIDSTFKETQIDYAEERKSVLSMARTFGLKIPGKRPSVTIVDFSVTVPVLGDSFDLSYCPFIRAGAQVTGGGKVFESAYDIDFKSPFSLGGTPNRLIIPNFNSNGNLVNYTITKREVVINGTTKTFKKTITSSDVKPFLEVILPDNDVLSVESVILKEGVNVEAEYIDYYNEEYKWYEVKSLAESVIFIEDNTAMTVNNIKPAKYINVDKKFITEYTDLGFMKLIFGGGSEDITSICDFTEDKMLVLKSMGSFINNLSLGKTLPVNHTMFIKYRVGGGSNTNIGQGLLTNKGVIDISVNGTNPNKNTAVMASLRVNNPFPALGGREEPSVEEVRNMVRYNFSAQDRAVTIKDYVSTIKTMPGRFGIPFRCGVFEEKNKIVISILGLNSEGKLNNSSNNLLKENLALYLSNYRMLNDYITIINGRIVNIGIEVDLMVDKQFQQSQIISETIKKIKDFFDINKRDLGENIYLSSLFEEINNVPGVLNVTDLRVFNKIGDGYSLNETSQPYSDEFTKELDTTEFTLFGDPISMFEILHPERDIVVRVK